MEMDARKRNKMGWEGMGLDEIRQDEMGYSGLEWNETECNGMGRDDMLQKGMKQKEL